VNWSGGALLVLAGPGSGKTRVLTMRIAKLILESPDQHFRVLGLTFTNKAAAEMRTRVNDMLAQGRERVMLTTFHAFSADVLRQHGNHIGIQPDFVILNQEADREALLLDAINAVQQNPNGIETDESDVRLLPLIDKLLANGVPEAEVASHFAKQDIAQKLSVLYNEYRQQLQCYNRLDFPSLLFCVYDLLTRFPALAQLLRTVYTHICVDEFQDTNLLQYRILRLLVGKDYTNLFVVADDDQIIYQWNGASPERLKELLQDFKMQVIQLPANYRCPHDIIELANKLIQRNQERSVGKAPLYAMKQTIGQSVRVKVFNTCDEEIAWIAQDIAQYPIEERGKRVILARTNKLLEAFCKGLQEENIAASLAIRKREFESMPFRWLHAMLRLAHARGEREQLRRVCKSFYMLEGINLNVQDIVVYSSALGGDFLRTWFERVLERKELDSETRSFLIQAKKQIVERMQFLAFIQEALRWFATLQDGMNQDPANVFAAFAEEKDTWIELQGQVLHKYGDDNTTLQTLLQEFDLAVKTPPIPPQAVRCLTIHSSKGMEFEHVYLVGMVEDQLPSYASIQQGANSCAMQEERRNCFVAITRVQSTLTMTYAREYFGWRKRPSRFLKEMGVVLNGFEP
jgi:DNA helicase-2/ATP-dependent DNA helicase PcrA